MRLCHSLYLFISLFIPLLSSCGNTTQEGDQTISNQTVEQELKEVRDEEVAQTVEVSLKGKWESYDNPIYPVLEFKGKSTVVLTTLLGEFATSYERDEEFIRVRTDKSDLLFEIVAEDSIIGSGFAKGVWIKEK